MKTPTGWFSRICVFYLYTVFAASCSGQRATVTWVATQSGQQLPTALIAGGKDADLNQVLYLCRVNMHGGIHPGKLLGNYCNVSYANTGAPYQQFDVATISGGNGHWGTWNAADKTDMLVGGAESNGTPIYVCRTSYHNGIHPGKLVSAGTCDFEWGGLEYSSPIANGQVFYLTPGPRLQPPPPPTVNRAAQAKTFHITVNASSKTWTLGVSLTQTQSAVISVPRRPDGKPQTWGVIDPHTRGETDITGNGVKAGPNFVLPNGKEGGLLIRDAHGAPREFNSVDEKITLQGPGDISFIANDDGACNQTPCRPAICFGCGPARDGFTDNVGWMEIEITVTTQ